MLSKANVPLEANLVAGLVQMGNAPILELELVPVLELENGSVLFQGTAIHKDCTTLAEFAPKDSMQNYLGKLLNEDIDADIAFKIY
jgi:hypothetical protein